MHACIDDDVSVLCTMYVMHVYGHTYGCVYMNPVDKNGL